MNYKIYMYAFFIVLSSLTFASINFNNFFKKDKEFEAKIFFIVISIISGYLLTNFVIDFTGMSFN